MYKKAISNPKATKANPQPKAANPQPKAANPQPKAANPQPKPQAQPDPWAKEVDLKELISSVNYFVRGAGHRFENAEKALKDHEARLKTLEASAAASASQPAATKQSATATQPQQPAPATQPQQPARQSQSSRTALAKNDVYIRKVYRARDYEAKCFYLVLDIWAAKQADPEYTPVWAWVNADGRIVRLLTKEELKQFFS